jgi:hypothetical protein
VAGGGFVPSPQLMVQLGIVSLSGSLLLRVTLGVMP